MRVWGGQVEEGLCTALGALRWLGAGCWERSVPGYWQEDVWMGGSPLSVTVALIAKLFCCAGACGMSEAVVADLFSAKVTVGRCFCACSETHPGRLKTPHSKVSRKLLRSASGFRNRSTG